MKSGLSEKVKNWTTDIKANLYHYCYNRIQLIPYS